MRKQTNVAYLLLPPRPSLYSPATCTLFEYFTFELNELLEAYKRRDARRVRFWKRRARETRSIFYTLQK